MDIGDTPSGEGMKGGGHEDPMDLSVLENKHKAMDVNEDGLVGPPSDKMPKQDPTDEWGADPLPRNSLMELSKLSVWWAVRQAS
ncbi:hypothetical protein [Halorhabdus amylolytica]|uniref:hypothetical protein n=1 Tax=Halorhabdus amylolytica TaxID=2559573 RepID=UPI0010A9D27B|nr:hypothetical protein [Halorhabdus amylolytica]